VLNYFAHARVAALRSADPALAGACDPAFVLGAMLPDFAHMIGARVSELAHPALRSGARHHHAADAAFHRAPAFAALLREATRALTAAGLARGPARGAAHVGIELLFDGALVGDPRADAAYVDALVAAPRVEAAIRWSDGDAPQRWQQLQVRLLASGPPLALRDPAQVAARVARALAPRPLLAVPAHQHAIVADWLAGARAEVATAAPRLLGETLERLPQP
jgi:hypothetical protein